ncbi:hypothetical protein IHE45_08G032700 [Dioscorea alata]|uniref:Uncharacterized protein n=1 Tax=Dioscorea alata TaxID=55571 RepID=A0ACB7VHZ8_DIOAL|nr:hypothetical protein IHE45_08G032700 [Dioscorea alata]
MGSGRPKGKGEWSWGWEKAGEWWQALLKHFFTKSLPSANIPSGTSSPYPILYITFPISSPSPHPFSHGLPPLTISITMHPIDHTSHSAIYLSPLAISDTIHNGMPPTTPSSPSFLPLILLAEPKCANLPIPSTALTNTFSPFTSSCITQATMCK